MKIMILVVSLLVAAVSQATSQYRGPYLYKHIGSNTCSVKPGSVTLIQDEEKQSFAVPVTLRLSDAKFRELIKKAKQDSLKKARVYVRATNPAVTIGAGLVPDIFSFDMYKDASNLSLMSGEAAQFLIKYVETLCVDLKAPKNK